jgi:hypothetical protein
MVMEVEVLNNSSKTTEKRFLEIEYLQFQKGGFSL